MNLKSLGATAHLDELKHRWTRRVAQSAELYDLRLFVERLPAEHRKLGRLIRRWLSAHSVSTDLEMARAFVESALRHHLAGDGDLNNAKTALLQTAIIYYARALERHSHHRETLRLGERLTPTPKTMHLRALALRDEALAHFGPAGVMKPWNEDHALLIIEGNIWQPAILSRRSLFQRDFAREFIKHLEEVCAIVISIVEDRRAAFEPVLYSAAEESQAVTDALLSCRLDEAEAAELFDVALSGPRRGRKIIERGD